MSDPSSQDAVRAAVLAGTLPEEGRTSTLPPAWSPASPEPDWFDRAFARLAPGAAPAPFPPPVEPREADDAPLQTLSVGGLLAAYRYGRTDPVEVVEQLAARAAAHPLGRDAVLAFVASAKADAAESLRRLRAGAPRALEGIPFGVKDLFDVAGAPVTAGSHATGDRVADTDACVVARLRAHGAIPLAVLATTEFASGSARNPRYGAVRNPWDPGRWTGGSSTGSACALAARLLPLALGSDTGGSVRMPAAWCGITGLKPTRGLVPRTGVIPLSWTLDHVGPMARSAADLARVMPLIAGPDGADPQAIARYAAERGRSDLRGLRIGVPAGWFVAMQDAAVLSAWQAALGVLESLGARMSPIDLGPVEEAHRDGFLILMSELASLQEPVFEREKDRYDVGCRARIEQGLAFSAVDYIRALRTRPLVFERIAAAMADVDVVVTPGLGSEAAHLDTLTVDVDGASHPLILVASRNTMIFDYTGLPALMLPSGFGPHGLPLAIQIVGKPFDDALCLSIGEAFQTATDHHRRAPPERWERCGPHTRPVSGR